MSISLSVLTQVLVMLLLISVGFFCFKRGVLTETTASQLSVVLLYIVTPAVILTAFKVEYNAAKAKGLLLSFAFAVLVHLAGVLCASLFFRKQKESKVYMIERFACIYGNASFMGLPIVSSVLPENGAFYSSVFIAVLNIFIWTQGINIFSGGINIKSFLRSLKSAPVLSVLVGLLVFFFSLKLPVVITSGLGYVAALNTPLAMLILGIYIAKTNILTAFKEIKIYKIAFVRLLFIPLIMIAFFAIFANNKDIADIVTVSLISSACPTAITTVLFATKFKIVPEYAAKIISVTTVLSIITIPMVMLIYEAIFKLIQ